MQSRTVFVDWKPSHHKIIEVPILQLQALYHVADILLYLESLHFLSERLNIAKAYFIVQVRIVYVSIKDVVLQYVDIIFILQVTVSCGVRKHADNKYQLVQIVLCCIVKRLCKIFLYQGMGKVLQLCKNFLINTKK